MRKTLIIAYTVILIAGPWLFAQEQTPSLGEIARKYREEKRLREAAANAPSTPQQPAVTPNNSVTADTKSGAQANTPPAVPVAPVPAIQQPAALSNSGNADIKSDAKSNESTKASVFPSAAPSQPVTLQQRTVAVSATATNAPSFPTATPQRPRTADIKAGDGDPNSDTKGNKPPAAAVFPSAAPSQPSVAALHRRVVSVNATTDDAPISLPFAPPSTHAASSTSGMMERHSEDQQSEMDDIYSSVGQNLQTPEGQKYSGVFAREFALKNSRGVRECLQAAHDPGPFDVVVQVGSDGATQQAMIFPETGISGCLRGRLGTASFSPPPKPGYWVKVTLANN